MGNIISALKANTTRICRLNAQKELTLRYTSRKINILTTKLKHIMTLESPQHRQNELKVLYRKMQSLNKELQVYGDKSMGNLRYDMNKNGDDKNDR